MRLTILTLSAMMITTLAAAIFFIRTADPPVAPPGPLLGKYTAGLRTASLAAKKPAPTSSPLTDVTIINAPTP